MRRLKDKVKTIKAEFGDLKGYFRTFDDGEGLILKDMIPYKYSINGKEFKNSYEMRGYINKLHKEKEVNK